jgi:hypothetical protein
MRRHLPIAIFLIAAGIALWAGKNGELNRIIRLLNRPSTGDATYATPADSRNNPFFNASTLSRVDKHPTELTENLQSLASLSQKLELTEQNQQSFEFLTTTAEQLRQSPALKMDLKAEISWNASPLAVAGQYAQLGEGKGQFRVDLRIGTKEQTQTLSKLCDGRFLYSLKSQGGRKTLEFIDLRRIEETRMSAGLVHSNNSTSWFAAEGLPSLLTNLSAAFFFAPPHVFANEGIEYLRLAGIWNPVALVELLKGNVPNHYLEPKIIWAQLPRHIPHQISFCFVRTSSLGWLPCQIGFYRFPPQRDPQTGETTGKPLALELLAQIQLLNAQQIQISPADFLQLDSNAIETIDNTPKYISQLRTHEIHRQAKSLQPGSPPSMLR